MVPPMLSLVIYVTVLALVTALFSLPVWRFVDGVASAPMSRVSAIDGLRGYCALSVVIHHAAVARVWVATGVWTPPADALFASLGTVGVSLFFMITGYLFWGKLVARDGKIDWIALYIGRFFRIAPVYWIAVTGVIAVVLYRTDFALHVSGRSMVSELIQWYSLGIVNAHDFNAYGDARAILAGVPWTLAYEWRFYIFLLPLSLFARRRVHLITAVVLLAIFAAVSMAGHSSAHSYLLFAIGMTVASLQAVRFTLIPKGTTGSLIAFAILVGTFIWCPEPYGLAQAVCLGTLFLLVCNGVSLFGVFTSKASVRLGHISYGVYLLQGFIFAIGFVDPTIKPWVIGSGFWLVTTAGTLLLCACSALVYARVERPMIAHGYRIGKQLSQQFRARIESRAAAEMS